MKKPIRTLTGSVAYYRARGLGEFPTDMLRYDCAFIAQPAPKPDFRSEPTPIIVAFPSFKTQGGVMKGAPTRDRWRSFVWSVVPIDEPGETLNDTWVTSKDGCEYITLADYLKEER
jgi:hypothetical protein